MWGIFRIFFWVVRSAAMELEENKGIGLMSKILGQSWVRSSNHAVSVLEGALVSMSTSSLKHLSSQLLYKEVVCYYSLLTKGNTRIPHVLCHILILLQSRKLDWIALLKSRGTQLGTIWYEVPPHSSCKIQTLFWIPPTTNFIPVSSDICTLL